MKKILVTGGVGFVGCHLIEAILKNTDWEITSLDRFDASGNPNRLSEMLQTTNFGDVHITGRIKSVFWDLKAELNEAVIKQLGGPFDYIAHLAAGSHVDRSIDDPMSFFMDNCIGTVNLLIYAYNEGLKREENFTDDPTAEMPFAGKFLYFSTDEVFGPAPLNGGFKGFREWDRHNPNNPYAAAKSAAEMAVISFANTYRIPCTITNTMNIFGERQAPEKFIPLVINKVLKGDKLLIHANKDKTQPGMRHYLHARNICNATIWILENGKTLDGSADRGRYNIVGEVEMDNLALAEMVTRFTNDWLIENDHEPQKLHYELVDFHSSRPGHDLRYALDGTHLKEEGFSFPVTFEQSLKKMVFWTLDNRERWL